MSTQYYDGHEENHFITAFSFPTDYPAGKYPLETVASLKMPRTYVKPEQTVEKVGRIFLTNPNLHSLPVVHHKMPVGIVHRYQLMDIFLTTYGRDLHGKKPISQFMNTNPLIVESKTAVETASQYITQNIHHSAMVQDFIITEDGKYIGMAMVLDLLKKITDLQIQEYNQALAQKVDELEKRTAELAIATMKAQTANEQAKAANQAKSRFLANMSHELRTPINAILGYCEILEDELEDGDVEAGQEDLGHIQKAGNHLLNMISDILEVSKLESDQLEYHLETFNFDSLVQEVVATVQPMVRDNKNVLSVEANYHGTMHADPLKIKQCVFNLLSNAAKFSKNSEILLFTTHEVVDGQDSVVFGVRDHGIGIAPEQMDKLFQAFTQADNSATRPYDGAGVGLTITKQFIEMMGGQISVESEVGKGSTFIVRLPAYVRLHCHNEPKN